MKIIDEPLYYVHAGGYTSNYMSYLFNDSVNGYEIQKEVIKEYYTDKINTHLNGISIMLRNTFKTCLYNCFKNNFKNDEIRKMICTYVQNDSILEAIKNDGAKKYFEKEYLSAIETKNVDYLYELGKVIYSKKRVRPLLMTLLAKFQVV